MPEKVKDILYSSALLWAKVVWKITKPKTIGARILLVTDTHVLLVQHRKSRTWNLPGGGKKKRETPEVCAVRELFEETKVCIKHIDEILGTYTNTKEGKKDTIHIFIKKVPTLLPIHASFELKRAQWFPFEELPENTTQATRARIREYLNAEKQIVKSW